MQNFLYFLIIAFLTNFISCSNAANFENPEDLAVAFFNDMKNLSDYENMSKIRNYFPTKDEWIDLLNKTGEAGESMDKLDEFIDSGIYRGIIRNLTEKVLGNKFVRQDEKFRQLKRQYKSIKFGDEKYAEAKMSLYNYVLPILSDTLKNAQYRSFSRGKSAVMGKLDVKVPGYRNSKIKYVLGTKDKYISFDGMSLTKNGWKIIKWD